MDKTFPYQVFEDNAGHLTLIVKDQEGRVVFAHSGYEESPGMLSVDLQSLDRGESPEGWDGHEEGVGGWYTMMAEDDNFRVIAWGQAGGREYAERMGRAGELEFRRDV